MNWILGCRVDKSGHSGTGTSFSSVLLLSSVSITPQTLHTRLHLNSPFIGTNRWNLGAFQKAMFFWKSKVMHRKERWFPETSKKVFSPVRPDCLWGLASLLPCGFQNSFPRWLKRPVREAVSIPPNNTEIKNKLSHTHTPHKCLYSVHQDTDKLEWQLMQCHIRTRDDCIKPPFI